MTRRHGGVRFGSEEYSAGGCDGTWCSPFATLVESPERGSRRYAYETPLRVENGSTRMLGLKISLYQTATSFTGHPIRRPSVQLIAM